MAKNLVERPYAIAAWALVIALTVIAVRKGTTYLAEHSI